MSHTRTRSCINIADIPDDVKTIHVLANGGSWIKGLKERGFEYAIPPPGLFKTSEQALYETKEFLKVCDTKFKIVETQANYRYIFSKNGRMIPNLEDIPEDCKEVFVGVSSEFEHILNGKMT